MFTYTGIPWERHAVHPEPPCQQEDRHHPVQDAEAVDVQHGLRAPRAAAHLLRRLRSQGEHCRRVSRCRPYCCPRDAAVCAPATPLGILCFVCCVVYHLVARLLVARLVGHVIGCSGGEQLRTAVGAAAEAAVAAPAILPVLACAWRRVIVGGVRLRPPFCEGARVACA